MSIRNCLTTASISQEVKEQVACEICSAVDQVAYSIL